MRNTATVCSHASDMPFSQIATRQRSESAYTCLLQDTIQQDMRHTMVMIPTHTLRMTPMRMLHTLSSQRKPRPRQPCSRQQFPLQRLPHLL